MHTISSNTSSSIKIEHKKSVLPGPRKKDELVSEFAKLKFSKSSEASNQFNQPALLQQNLSLSSEDSEKNHNTGRVFSRVVHPVPENPAIPMINGLPIPCFTTNHLSKVPIDENVDAAWRLLDWYREAYPDDLRGYDQLNNVIQGAKGDVRLNRWLKGITFYFERAAQNSEMAKQQRARVLADIAAADSCPPTKRRVVRQKYHEVVGGNADNRILQMVQEVKEDIILRYCQVERNIGQWHVISYIANSPLGRRLGLDTRAAQADEFRGCGYIDLDEVERIFQTEYTEEAIVHAITEKVNLEISKNPDLRNAIQNHLIDTFKERIEAAGNRIDRIGANRWLTQQGYCTYHDAEEEFKDPISGEIVSFEVERLATITPKVAVLYLQKVGILQTQ